MNEEQWQTVAGASGYVISNRGNIVKTFGSVDEDVEGYVDRDGHVYVTLWVETRQYDYDLGKWVRVQECIPVWLLMVKSWFLGWERGFEIYHLDGDLTNNSAENLRARTVDRHNGEIRVVGVRQEPYFYAFDKRRRGRVEIIETGEVFEGVRHAAARVQGSAGNISRVLSGSLNTHKGLHFRWVE